MKNRNGFTLIELLIVIVVIAVLAAMMMLSSNETVSSAQAAKIINDMTQPWYVEHHDQIKQGLTGDNNVKEEFGINNNGKIMRFSDYMKSKGSEA